MNAEIKETTSGGSSLLHMRNGTLDLKIAPSLGGKITSICSAASGREWLWVNPHLHQRDPTGHTDYVGEFDTGGWDEVFPTLNPCRLPNTPWGETTLSDHGEIWRRPAEVTTTTQRSVRLRTTGDPLPFSFERVLTLESEEPKFDIAYRLVNHTDQPLPYTWAAHPLLNIEPGMRINLPPGVQASITGWFGENPPQLGKLFDWPLVPAARGEPRDLSRVPEPIDIALMLFTQPLEPGWVEVTTADDRESLRFDFTHSPPHRIGMWLNYGGWSGSGSTPYFNAGIEPATSPCDTLADAIAADLAAVVPPNGSQQWTVTTTLTEHVGE